MVTQVDNKGPVIENLSVDTADWAAKKIITGTITETQSAIKSYCILRDTSVTPEKDSRCWIAVPESTYTYTFTKSVTTVGTYSIWAQDELGNISYLYNSNKITVDKIDITVPTVGIISQNSTNWETSKTITSTLADSESLVKYYALIKDSKEKPAVDSPEWKEIAPISSYRFSQKITENGTYYLWAKDSVGNISSTVRSIVISKIDTNGPTFDITVLEDSTDTFCSNKNKNWKPVKITIKDAESGIKYYVVTGLIIGQPADSSWKEIPVTSTYEYTGKACYNSTATGGDYIIWAKDALGHVSSYGNRLIYAEKNK